METLTHEEGELVSVLAGGGDPHCAGPVVVKVAQLAGQLRQVVGRLDGGVVFALAEGFISWKFALCSSEMTVMK